MAKIKENSPIHTLISDPIDVRRHILLASVDSLRSLEKYETFKKLKNLKKKKFADLSERLKQINSEITHLTSVLPELREKKIERRITKSSDKEELVKTKKNDRLSGLHQEIMEIKDKLSRLDF